jgi:CspA family cold shock protein
MAKGTVKWFNSKKRYGFILPEDGGKDIFVHMNALEKSGLRFLNPDDEISYDVAMDKDKEVAENIKVLKQASRPSRF